MDISQAVERVAKEIPQKRAEEREERLFQKAQRAADDKAGTTQDLIDGGTSNVDMDDPREHCLNQDRIDTLRANTTFRTLLKAYEKEDMTLAEGVQYLWFPEDDIRKVELRFGNPPADQDRPEHLRGYTLVMDHLAAPAPLQAIIQNAAASLRKLHKKLIKDNNPYRRALQDDQNLARALRAKKGLTRQ